jgi:hypothetical protein
VKLGNGTRSSDWRGVVALLLAIGVAGSALALAIGDAVRVSTPAEDATILSTILGASVGAIAGYIGARTNQPKPDAELEDDGD